MSALFWFSMGVLATFSVSVAVVALLAWRAPVMDILGVDSDDGDRT